MKLVKHNLFFAPIVFLINITLSGQHVQYPYTEREVYEEALEELSQAIGKKNIEENRLISIIGDEGINAQIAPYGLKINELNKKYKQWQTSKDPNEWNGIQEEAQQLDNAINLYTLSNGPWLSYDHRRQLEYYGQILKNKYGIR